MVTLNDIEDGIVAALQGDDDVEFDDALIMAATALDEAHKKTAMASGGIAVTYAGSTLIDNLVHGHPITREVRFVVMVGRKNQGKRRLSHDIMSVVEVLTRQPIAEVQLTWQSDQLALIHNGVAWHDIVLTARMNAQA